MARRGGLSAASIIEAAIARIDRDGMDQLSMRELARDLEVTPMALYRHVKSKEELVELAADQVIARFAPEPSDAGWEEQALRVCRRIRSELLAHPDLAYSVLLRPVTSSAASLQVNGAIVSLFVQSGLPRDHVPQVYWSLSTYTMGSALFEIERRRALGARRRRDGATRHRDLQLLVKAFEADVPDTDALAAVLSADFGEEQFEFGLHALVAGLSDTLGALTAGEDRASGE